MLWQKGVVLLWNWHKSRLERTLRVLEQPMLFDIEEIEDFLATINPTEGSAPKKIKITTNGEFWTGEVSEFAPWEREIVVELKKFERKTPEIKYVTNNYEAIRKNQSDKATETLLVNAQNEITEGNVTNVFIKKGKTWITPAKNCLLGVMRAEFIRILTQKGEKVKEGVVGVADLAKADEIWLTNALRGAVRVKKVLNLEGFL